jgi:hypothetical protein
MKGENVAVRELTPDWRHRSTVYAPCAGCVMARIRYDMQILRLRVLHMKDAAPPTPMDAVTLCATEQSHGGIHLPSCASMWNEAIATHFYKMQG